MHAAARRPPKPKQSDRHTEAASHGTVQAMFRACLAAALGDGAVVQLRIDELVEGDTADDRQAHAHADRHKRQAVLMRREAVFFGEGVGDRGEERE